MKTRTSYSMIVLGLLASLLLSSCAALAPAPTNTPLPPTLTPKPTVTSTSTPKPTSTPLPTATPNLAATQQVEDFAAIVKGYYAAGYLTTADGTYTHLADVTHELSEINYYKEWTARISPTDFVLKSDVSWDSASPAADSSGCGFVFREQPNTDEYMVYASLKGYVEATYYIGAKSKYAMGMGVGTFGNPAQR